MFTKAFNKYYTKFYTNKYISKFSKIFGAKHLWDLERASIAKAIGLGVGCAWIPLPFHTLIAISLAVIIDCNIPVVACAIWVANPLTMPFMYYFAYKLGDALLKVHAAHLSMHMSIKNVLEVLHEVWEPFILGCAVSALVSGFLSYLFITLLWPRINRRIKRHN